LRIHAARVALGAIKFRSGRLIFLNPVGEFVALAGAIRTLQKKGELKKSPLLVPVAAISCGIVKGRALLDLDYEEDSSAEVDANIIMTAEGRIVELQMSGEESTFSESELASLLTLGKAGIIALVQKQREALGN
jgi:ribonuclease PH